MPQDAMIKIRIITPNFKQGHEIFSEENKPVSQVILEIMNEQGQEIQLDQITVINKSDGKNEIQTNKQIKVSQLGKNCEIQLLYNLESQVQNAKENQNQQYVQQKENALKLSKKQSQMEIQHHQLNDIFNKQQQQEQKQVYDQVEQDLNLQLYMQTQPTQNDPIFDNFECDYQKCKVSPIVKVRYSCIQCQFDLCWKCFNNKEIRRKHPHPKCTQFRKLTFETVVKQQQKKAENKYTNLGLAGKIKRK